MSPYRNHIRFFVILFIFTSVLAGFRLHWISKALPSKATVLHIKERRFIKNPMQYYPVVSYETIEGNIVTRGTYNLPIETGQTVDILYNPDDVQKFRLNTRYWLWYDLWSWYRLILVIIALYYIVLFIVKRSSRHPPLNTPKDSNEIEPNTDFADVKIPSISVQRPSSHNTKAVHPNRRSPRAAKAVLLLLLPISIFLIGQIWEVPYARGLAVVIFLGLFALGSPPASKSDGEL